MASLFSEALELTLTKAGKDSDFKLKTEQKSVIEAVVDFFHTICQDCNCPKAFPANFRTQDFFTIWSYFDVSNLFQLFSKILLYPELSEIIDRIVASLEARSAATANSFINSRYTISLIFRDLFQFHLNYKPNFLKTKRFSFFAYLQLAALAEKSVKETFHLNEPIMRVFSVPCENQ